MDEAQRAEVSGTGFTLTPAGLVNSPIKTNLFGGYSKTQVDDLLERAAELLESVLQENRQLKQKQVELEHSVEKYRELQCALQNPLVSPQKMGENMVAAAKLQADALLEEARLAKSKAAFKMEVLPQGLRSEIHRLTSARERMRDELAALLEYHRQIIERIPKAESLSDDYIQKERQNNPYSDDNNILSDDEINTGPSPPLPAVTNLDDDDESEDFGYVNL